MTRTNNHLIRLLGTALPVLAVMLLANDARASCGHYVKIGQPTAGPESDLSHRPVAPVKCTGPMCSQHEGPAPAAPMTVPTSYSQDQAGMILSWSLDALEGRRTVQTDERHSAIHFSSDIFHPPRAS